jgi:hypothetical protein
VSTAPTVITLTTIPPRFHVLAPTLASLVGQDLPAPVELWVPTAYRRFPDWDGVLPRVPDGVTIRRCDTDWGPATKIVPAVLERAGQGVDLLFCDDDSLYAPDWHRRFKALRAARPTQALAALGRHLPGLGPAPRARADRMPRMRRRPKAEVGPILAAQGLGDGPPVSLVAESGFADLLSGWGGVMVRPDFFDPALAQGPGACWPVDDIWLSAMLDRGGIGIWVERSILPPARRDAGGVADLTRSRVDSLDRNQLDASCVAAMRTPPPAGPGAWPDPDLRAPAPPLWRRLARRLRRG